jgi:HSP20 family molecular chaperone IbpA
MSLEKLSLEGLDFQATKINIKNNVLTITLNRPEKKKCIK